MKHKVLFDKLNMPTKILFLVTLAIATPILFLVDSILVVCSALIRK